MRTYQIASACAAFLILTGCTSFLSRSGLPKTMGEQSSGYGYVPLDPLPIDETKCSITTKFPSNTLPPSLLAALPDFAIRLAISNLSGSAGPKYGPISVTVAGNHYKVVMDYINADVVPMTFLVMRWDVPIGGDNLTAKPFAPSMPVQAGQKVLRYQVEYIGRLGEDGKTSLQPSSSDRGSIYVGNHLNPQSYFVERYTFPIYVGVGLRLTADVQARKAGVSLTGLSSIGLAAEANKVVGSLTVQTLGINGKVINVALPNVNKLDQSTIENAVLAVGGMRALIYSADATDAAVHIEPRVVGLYSPIDPDPTLVNAIYSSLALNKPRWVDPCPPVVQSAPPQPNQGKARAEDEKTAKVAIKAHKGRSEAGSRMAGLSRPKGSAAHLPKVGSSTSEEPASLASPSAAPSSSTIQAPPPPPPD